MAEAVADIDIRAVRTFHGSPGKLAGLLAMGLGLTAVCLALAFGVLAGAGEDAEAGMAIGWIGTLFFGAITVVFVRRLLRWKTPVVTISPEGICDKRVGNVLVGWPEVTDVRVWSARVSRFVQLAVTTETERRLFKTPLARSLNLANKALGSSGLAINAAGLDTSTEALAGLCEAYWRAYNKTEGT